MTSTFTFSKNSIVARLCAIHPAWKFAIVVIIIALVGLFSSYMPVSLEWPRTFRASVRAVVEGRDPYTNQYFFNAPWALVPFIPLALLPEKVGGVLFFWMGFFGFAYSARRFGARRFGLVAFLLSPIVIQSLLSGNVDWMPLLGFGLPPQIGLIFVTIKPQMGSAVALFWFVEAWRMGGIREVGRVFLPVTILGLLSLVMFGLWPLRFNGAFQVGVNVSLWPLSIPAGLALFARSIRKRRIEYAMGAAPCLSPYIGLESWAGALLTLVSHDLEMCSAVLGLWVLVLLKVL